MAMTGNAFSGHPDVQDASAEAGSRCRRLGKPAGIMGFTLVAVGSDSGLLRRSSETLLKIYVPLL